MEYTKKCNVCGKVFCFTDEDVKKNALNKGLAALSSLGALASLGGGTIFHTHHLQGQADRYTDGVVDFDQCPYCHSRNVSFCTDEEAASLERKASAPAININSGASTESLLKRAFMFLEDGDWTSAEAYSEACLDKDPELAEAYLAKLMAELKVAKRDALRDQAESFEDKSNYQKALRFADEQLRAELTQYITHINTRNENYRKDDIYRRASNIIEAANTESECQEAAQLFASISGWKDAAAQMAACQKRLAQVQAQREQQEEIARKENERKAKQKKRIFAITAPIVCIVIVAVVVLNTVIIPNGKYNDAVALIGAGKYVEAYEALIGLGGYKDSEEKASSIYDKYKVEKLVEKLKASKVGDYVTFGVYEQDNVTSNGKEDIEWRILDINDDKALVISKYALDCKQYNTSRADVTWEACSLRKWLNSEFLNAAFTADEKAAIPTVTVSADNPDYSTNPGTITQDQVFLLSIAEIEEYLTFDYSRTCKRTDYAAANGVMYLSNELDCQWWLRTHGDAKNTAAYIYYFGYIWDEIVDQSGIAVRPALWIDLDVGN